MKVARVHLWVFTFLVLISVTSSCVGNESNFCADAPDISNQKITINFEVLTEQLRNIEDIQSAGQFLQKYPFYKALFLDVPPEADDSLAASVLFKIMNNASIDTLYQEVKRSFGNFELLKQEFIDAFSYFKHYYPSFEPPEIKVLYSGLVNDLYISDSLVLIGADFFIGPNATYKPLNIPSYISKRYIKAHIVPSVIRYLSSAYIKIDQSDKSMLSEMVSWGKSYYFTKSMLPCSPDSIIIQYSQSEIEGVTNNKNIIWASFLQNQLIYESDHLIKRKFLEERPITVEIGSDCPGRVGTWLGWEIVKAFMLNHKDEDLHSLMENTNARDIFKRSSYKP